MVFKLLEAAQKSWRRLDGHNQLPKLVLGVTFNDGIEVIAKPDKITYSARRIVTSRESCEIEGGLTRYLSGLKAHHALQHELLSVAYKLQAQGRLTVGNLQRSLKKRPTFFAAPAAAQLGYRPMSISALMIHQTRDEGYKIIIRKRSPSVAIDSGLLQAVPGFTFQPEVDEAKEWDVQHCLIKEYCEELFDEKVDETKSVTPECRRIPEWLAAQTCSHC